MQRLELYVSDKAVQVICDADRLLEFKIYYWVIKELHFSPYRDYLQKITRETLMNKYQKTKKYIYEERSRTLQDFLNYFVKSLQNEADEVFAYAT